MGKTWLLLIALMLAAVSISCALVFARAAAASTASGVIHAIHHKPAGVTWQYPVPTGNRGFNTGTPIPTAEAYVIVVDVAGWKEPVRGLVSPTEGKKFTVGQRVHIECLERRFLFWKRRYVTGVTSVEGP